jgi:hypothetical protein
MATLKRVDKRLNDVEKWIKEFENNSGPAQTMDNMNFLVTQTRQLGERMQGADSHINELRWEKETPKGSKLPERSTNKMKKKKNARRSRKSD